MTKQKKVATKKVVVSKKAQKVTNHTAKHEAAAPTQSTPRKVVRSKEMKFLDDVTREAVLQAIAQFDQLPDNQRARSNTAFLIHGGKQYPPKAIVVMALDIVGWETGTDSFNTYMALDVLTFLGFETKSNRKGKSSPKGTISTTKQLSINPAEFIEGFKAMPKDKRAKLMKAIIENVLRELPDATFEKE